MSYYHDLKKLATQHGFEGPPFDQDTIEVFLLDKGIEIPAEEPAPAGEPKKAEPTLRERLAEVTVNIKAIDEEIDIVRRDISLADGKTTGLRGQRTVLMDRRNELEREHKLLHNKLELAQARGEI